MNSRGVAWSGVVLTLTGVVLLGIGSLVSPLDAGSTRPGWGGGGMMGGGMMGGNWSAPIAGPGPGATGFVAGTAAAPRIVRIVATPQLRFLPDSVTIQAGETITFEVATVGPIVHEFMVGPAADVAANLAGTPEITDLGMTTPRSLTYTFAGPGPYAFACHAPGHYEAGMTGTIVIRQG